MKDFSEKELKLLQNYLRTSLLNSTGWFRTWGDFEDMLGVFRHVEENLKQEE